MRLLELFANTLKQRSLTTVTLQTAAHADINISVVVAVYNADNVYVLKHPYKTDIGLHTPAADGIKVFVTR